MRIPDPILTRCCAALSQLRNIDSKRLVKKVGIVNDDALLAIKKEASRVNFG